MPGDQGTPGFPGQRGRTGRSGAKGEAGSYGFPGPAGFKGEPGMEGDPGEMGLPGNFKIVQHLSQHFHFQERWWYTLLPLCGNVIPNKVRFLLDFGQNYVFVISLKRGICYFSWCISFTDRIILACDFMF